MRRTSRSDADFQAEIEAHLQLEIDALVDEGMSPSEARREAKRRFGNVTGAQEKFYEGNRFLWLDNLRRDVLLALRQLWGAPLSTLLVLASLTLAIGLNGAVFSLADQTLLRSLPIEDPKGLVQLEWDGQFVGQGMGNVGFGKLIPFPLFRELSERDDVFSQLFARSTTDVHLALDGRPQPVVAELVTGRYFETLGIRPARGRLFDTSDDERPLGHPSVVLSHGFWTTATGGDEDIVGRTVNLNDFPMTVVGVAQPGFNGTDLGTPPDLFLPMMMKERATPGWSGLEAHRTRFSQTFGRLADGVSVEQAEARLQPFFKNYLEEDTRRDHWPQLTEQQESAYFASTLALQPGSQGESRLRQQVGRPLLILAVTSALVFLLACLNVANLTMARVLAASRATALRTALGAPRSRLLVQQLTESALLAGAGCVLGLFSAPFVSRFLVGFLADGVGNTLSLQPDVDLRLLAFAAAATLLTTVLAGLAPAWFAAGAKPVDVLKQKSDVGGKGLSARRVLVVAQVALALLLLVGAGLFSRTLGTLRSEGPGYSTENLLMFRLAPAVDGIEMAQTEPLVARLLEEIEALPDVVAAGASSFAMLRGSGWNNPVTVRGRTTVATEDSLPMNAVSPGFFETLGARIVRGRPFNGLDDQEGWDLRSTIVNEEFVRRYLEGAEPIGARLGFGNRPDADVSIEIVGVVSDFQDFSLRDSEAQVYFSLWERRVGDATFYVRASTSSEAAMRSVRSAIAQTEPRLTLLSLRTIDDQLDRMLATERMLATLATAFALIATALAVIGLFGVLSYSAERRTREVGIRIALGADRWRAAGLMVREAASLSLYGLLVALPLCWGLGRLIESQLYGVAPTDPATLFLATLGLLGVCLAASLLPARRVSRMDPLIALRSEN